LLGVLAVVVGVAVGVLLFVPFVAVSYRRRGGFSVGRALVWAAALVYVLAVWTYTLLPLPDPNEIDCAGANLDPLEFIDDIRGAISRPGDTFTDPAVLQLLLNVLLFVPLGFFVRILAGRGLHVTTVVGLGLSAVIEFTQLTGVWGLYPCAYRVFDVDDLLTNTIGATIGALLSLGLPRPLRRAISGRADASRLTTVTRGRRFVGMLCDALGFGLVSLTIGVSVQVFLQYVVGDRDAVLDGAIASVAATVGPLVLWLALVLITGQSVGDLAVQIRFVDGRGPRVVSRLLRWIGGISGYALLNALPSPFSLAGLAFGAASVVLLFTTASGRGLPGLLSGMRVESTHLPAEPARPSIRG
jgi:hypothetical protein